MVKGETYQVITIPGGGVLTQVGKPQVPLVCRFVALPPTSGAKVYVIEEEEEMLSGTFRLYPFQKPPQRSGEQEPQEFRLDQAIYSQDQPFPGKIANAGQISILRDLRLAPIIFYPVQFNPQTGKVTVYKKIVVEIKFEGEGENPQLNPRNVLTRSFYKTYEKFVLNFDQIKGGKDVIDGSILIITYDNFHDQAQPLADWKNKMGYSTHLVNLSAVGSTNTQIYNYIYNAYHSWPDPPEYVILVGDAQQIPTNNGLTCITDHKYATVDGSDYFADIHIGRISVQTEADANHVITKILNYRKNPYMSQTDWFKKAMTISGSDYVDDYNAARCGFLMVNYAGFTSFDSLWASRGTNTVTQVTTRLNQGRSWLVYFGHGSATTWASTSPSFTNSNIDALSNGEKLPAIFDVACNNGEFNYSGGDCFAERWIKTGSVGNEKGAVIICASTEGSEFFYSDTLGRGTFIAYFADSNFHFTPAVNQGKMYMYTYFPEAAGGTTEREMQMYTTFGDPELDPWSGIPENLLVDYPSTVPMAPSQVTITVNRTGGPVYGALVCLRKGAEVFESGYTNAAGQVTLYVSPLTPGYLEL
ncbi:MAG: C25 family cysteine peptidase, partial [Dehalococcoidia bacterium]|nr:C25 family cysteine peptidase [Dehalococcoidia bacterium]